MPSFKHLAYQLHWSSKPRLSIGFKGIFQENLHLKQETENKLFLEEFRDLNVKSKTLRSNLNLFQNNIYI